MIPPVYPLDYEKHLTPEIVRYNSILYAVFHEVTTSRRSIMAQVRAAKAQQQIRLVLGQAEAEGYQSVQTFIGNILDQMFKAEVCRRRQLGFLPPELHVTPIGMRGPDVWLGRVAWEVTTAEAVRAHIRRDVLKDELRWDLYFVFAY